MKDFLKMVLAVVVALCFVSFVSVIVSIASIGSLAVGESAQIKLPKSGVLKIDMSKLNITEQTVDLGILTSLTQEDISQIGLLDAVKALQAAADDPAVEYVYLKTDSGLTSLSSLEELRKALEVFRQSGKAVIAYSENPTAAGLYLASVADKAYISSYPGATYTVTGVSSQMLYLKDLLDKLGVNVQLIRHGKYKSAGETFVRSTPSAENIEQYKVMLCSIWDNLAEAICAGRGIEKSALDSAIDNLQLCFPQDFVNLGLADEAVTRDELKGKLTVFSVKEKFSDVKFIKFADYVSVKATKSFSAGFGDKIAVVFANGEIVDGYDDVQNVAGDYFASMIAEVRADSSVKAVVLRVNSPGGSVVASEKIRSEIALLKQVKPVVASYGDYAASGGYWISAGCDKIFTDKTTLTGSIGVFGMVPDFSKTMKNVAHVNVVSVGTHKHSDMFSLMRPFDAAEYAYMQASIEDIYGRFVGVVSDGRGLSPEYVDEVGQGRVWTGTDAIAKGLVDEVGTLSDAIHYTAALVGEPDMTKWSVQEYPAAPTPLDYILAMLGAEEDLDDEIFADTPFAGVSAAMMDWYKNFKGNKNYLFARMPYVYQIQ